MTVLKWIFSIVMAFAVGKLINKLRLPAILGWLITGIIVGPYAFSLVSDELTGTVWYQTMIHILECTVGIMIGTELIWRKIRSYGKALIITTLTQSLGTFALVSLVFTGIAVSTLSAGSDSCIHIIQGTIAAAAVINEIIAVIAAKKGFELAGEITDGKSEENVHVETNTDYR